ncbi:MAG: hypothetical protein GY912_09760, partial [Candidatus Marinimicrobia bacterium]|nr:hypothetical protein [Candidatus Neomarinimicrobiota bacterium]
MRKTIPFIVCFSIGFGQVSPLGPSNFTVQKDSIELSLSAKAMFKSLILPGWGQIQNSDPWWKPVLFAGVETIGWVSSSRYSGRAESIRR